MTVTVYGIPNCDTIRKARRWLDERGIAYLFHNYKTDGIERAKLENWAEKVGWPTLLNRAGTTFLIKRPVVERGEQLMVAFDLTRYDQFFR
jgi:arsenate reductase